MDDIYILGKNNPYCYYGVRQLSILGNNATFKSNVLQFFSSYCSVSLVWIIVDLLQDCFV